MTNEKINRAVAEELGWKIEFDGDEFWGCFTPDGECLTYARTEVGAWDYTPNFVESYDAAAEMRKGIRQEEQRRYAQWLLTVVLGPESSGLIEIYWRIINASPLQQAEAFLRMRGKWRDNG